MLVDIDEDGIVQMFEDSGDVAEPIPFSRPRRASLEVVRSDRRRRGED